jgi:serine/threonine protein kinase
VLSVDQAKRAAVHLIEALDYLHLKNLAHYDIKPANLWLCDDGSTRLLDFGSAGSLASLYSPTTAHSNVTTEEYAPPEVLNGEARRCGTALTLLKVDVWSLGATLLDAAFAVRAFNDPDEMRRLRDRQDWVLQEAIDAPGNFPESRALWEEPALKEVRAVVEMSLVWDLAARASIADIVSSEAFHALKLSI